MLDSVRIWKGVSHTFLLNDFDCRILIVLSESCWAIHTRDFRIHDPQNCQILVTVPEMLATMLLSPPLARSWTPRIKRYVYSFLVLLLFLILFIVISNCHFNRQHRVGWDSFHRSTRGRGSLGTDSTICLLPDYVRRFLIAYYSHREQIILIEVYRRRLAHLSDSAIGYQTFRRHMALNSTLFNTNTDTPIFASSSISSTARRPLRA